MPADLKDFRAQVVSAAADHRPLRIRGAGTKNFYGGLSTGEDISMNAWTGIVEYEPTELVVTARAGTPISELDGALAAQNQELAFEPAVFGGRATLGGAVASGLAGPRRAYAGAVRDFLLGVRLIDGRGHDLHFGGAVIKNVAGFDVTRLMAGSLGTLGLLTEVTLRTLPRCAAVCTLRFALDQSQALERMNHWKGRPLPLSATLWHDGELRVRLSGSRSAVAVARAELGGERIDDDGQWWTRVREQQLDFFAGDAEVWRVSVPPATAALPGNAPTLIEWGGALRWFRGPMDGAALRARLVPLRGHATLYRAPQNSAAPFSAMPRAMLALHQRLKAAFDPCGIFNRGRLHPDL